MNRAMQCYLKARELHLMFTREANARACALFREAIRLDDRFHRARGHLAYSSIQAWIYCWRKTIDWDDVRDLAWRAVYSTSHPKRTEHEGAGDYDNWWSVGVALLYHAAHGGLEDKKDRSDAFNASIEHYERARTMAWPEEDDPRTMVAVKEDLADLLADYAEALYFRGDRGDVQEALRLLDKSKKLGADHHPKWHDWNRAWAYYELGNELGARRAGAKSKEAYREAIKLLRRLPTLPNQFRRTLAVCCAALEEDGEAHRAGQEFRAHEEARGHRYDPEVENRWPYKDLARREKLHEHLRRAGVLEPQ